MGSVRVDVEYCTVCGFKGKCEDLKKIIIEQYPEAHVECHAGRRGSFEVQINNTLIHSKISRAAFPDYNDVVRNVELAAHGQPVEKAKEQPITDCVIQ